MSIRHAALSLFVSMFVFFFQAQTVFAARSSPESSDKHVVLNVHDFGAVGDGRHDDTSAIQGVLSAAKSRNAGVYIPAGNYLYSGQLTVDGISLVGDSDKTNLIAADPNQSMIQLVGSKPEIKSVSIRSNATEIIHSGHAFGVIIDQASDFLVQDCSIYSVGGMGIQVKRSHAGRIIGNRILHSYKDGIHSTAGSTNILIEGNKVQDTGDDGIAVVSYKKDDAQAADITIKDNIVSGGIARGISVVGGDRIKIIGNDVRGKDRYGIYLASESSFDTYAALNVVVINNKFIGFSGNSDSRAMYIHDGNHLAPQKLTLIGNVFSGGVSESTIDGATDITLCGNYFLDPLRIRGSNSGISVENNAFTGKSGHYITVDQGTSPDLHVHSNWLDGSSVSDQSKYVQIGGSGSIGDNYVRKFDPNANIADKCTIPSG